MAVCPYCHSEKPLAAPVCFECNHDTPFLFTVGFNILFATLPLVMFVGFFWFLGWLFSS